MNNWNDEFDELDELFPDFGGSDGLRPCKICGNEATGELCNQCRQQAQEDRVDPEDEALEELEQRADELADEVLASYPRCWPNRRAWAKEKAAETILEYLQDDELDDDEREEMAREAASEWIQESWANRE